MKITTKKMVLIAMMCAAAYAAVALIRIPTWFAPFLKYEPKDVIIVITGFMLGTAAAAVTSLVSALIELVSISDTGIIGFIMNVLSSAGFAVTAAVIYKRVHSFKGAIIGLISGIIVMTVLMLIWNYMITPMYMDKPRSEVAGMLIPIFLPFNLMKGAVNSVITLLIYKPITRALRKGNLLV